MKYYPDKPFPPNFRGAKCCGTCVHLYDESNVTACIKHDFTKTYILSVCDDWE